MRSIRIKLVSVNIIILALAFVLVCPAWGNNTKSIRVGLLSYGTIRQLTITPSSGNLSVTINNLPCQGTPCVSLNVLSGEAGIVLRPSPNVSVEAKGAIQIAAIEPSASIGIQANGRLIKYYKGTIELTETNRSITLVNVVGLEDYVAGVIQAEMPDSYPLEALKAQAITIRTYSLRNSGKHNSAGFDVCDTTNCQSYCGVPSKKPKCAKAVSETAGMTLTYSGEIAHVFYCADGGGATQDYSETHPTVSLPYLKGAIDPKDIPHIAWEKSYTLAQLSTKMVQAGIKEADSLQGLTITKIGSSGHVLAMDVIGGAGSASVSGIKLRSILGEDALKSTLFTIEQSKDGIVTFKGKGYGHGYGLCQMGAKGLAQPPYNYTYTQLLAHYFPGTEITPISDPSANSQPHQPATTVETPKPQPPAKKQDGLTFQVRIKAPDRL